MSGFVYIWRDRKHNRYYIGCHWGSEDDGYICSSPWMKQAYKHRPQDFKRKILKRNILDRKELLDEEYKWLSKIKPEEIRVRYYNLNTKPHGHWTTNTDTRNIKQKISDAGKKRIVSDETKAKISAAQIGRKPHSWSEESKLKLIKSLTGRKLHKSHIENMRKGNIGKKRERIQCPHCLNIGAKGVMNVWHFNMCLNNPNITQEQLNIRKKLSDLRSKNSISMWCNPEYREHNANLLKSRWADLEYKKRIGSSIKESLNNPEVKSNRSIILKTSWDNDPNRRIRASELMKSRMADPQINRMIGKAVSDAKKGKSQHQLTCPHCQLVGGASNMTRFHFDNCKKLKCI